MVQESKGAYSVIDAFIGYFGENAYLKLVADRTASGFSSESDLNGTGHEVIEIDPITNEWTVASSGNNVMTPGGGAPNQEFFALSDAEAIYTATGPGIMEWWPSSASVILHETRSVPLTRQMLLDSVLEKLPSFANTFEENQARAELHVGLNTASLGKLQYKFNVNKTPDPVTVIWYVKFTPDDSSLPPIITPMSWTGSNVLETPVYAIDPTTLNGGKNGVYTVVSVPLDIEEVCSDQISGNEANKLPTAYYRLQPNNPMLMATRTGTDARLAVKMNVPTEIASSIRVGVRLRGESAIINSVPSVSLPEKTLLSFTAVDGSKLYEVVAGFDANENGLLDLSEVSTVFQKTPKTNEDGAPYSPLPGTTGDPSFQYLDRIIVVTENDFTSARATTEGYGTNPVFSATYPTAAKFIQAFGAGANTITGASPPEFGVLLDANIIPSTDGLSHPVGAKWNSAKQANTHRLVLPFNSALAGKVVVSNGIKQMYGRILAANKSTLASLATPGWLTTTLPVDDRDIDFSRSDNKNEVHVALGKCRFVGSLEVSYRSLPTGGFEVGSLDCHGSIVDLYDFAYGAPVISILFVDIINPKNPARTQAGNATLATSPWPDAGRVFFTKVEIATGWHVYNAIYK